jgi:hypothetical protein
MAQFSGVRSKAAIEPYFLSIIGNMNFSLIRAPSEMRFITCDSPVAFYIPNYENKRPYGVGFLDKEIEISIPLTPKILLFVSWKQKEENKMASPEDVIEFNRRTIIMSDHFIYSSSIFVGLIKQISNFHNNTAGFKIETIDYGHGFCQHAYFIPVNG